jgi:uncharacterized Tic20 family protein
MDMALDRETRSWAVALHLSLLAGYIVPLAGFVAPMLIWQIKKDELPGLDAHGRAAANWIVSHLLYALVGGLLVFVLIGIPILFVLAIISVAYPIIGAIKAADGRCWHYAGSMPMF